MSRVAIVDKQLCKSDKCNFECMRVCVVNRSGKECISIKDKYADIEESMCLGSDCGACVKKCPFGAVKIINLPKILSPDKIIYQYSANGFRLFSLPLITKNNNIMGLIGENGIGKSTILRILSFSLPISKRFFKGSELFNYFDKPKKVGIKFQEIEYVQNSLKDGSVSFYITDDTIISQLNLQNILNKSIKVLSGGELQKFCIGLTLQTQENKDLLFFDEPSAYLDIIQRLNIAKNLNEYSKIRLIIDHDLVFLDYISDQISVLWGEKAAYGVVSNPMSTFEGINQYLDGYLKSENLRFRDNPITFRNKSIQDNDIEYKLYLEYTQFNVSFGNEFKLDVNKGNLHTSEIIMLIGENGIGKTTFLKHFVTEYNKSISYKPQLINPTFNGTVKELFESKLSNFYHPQFQIDVVTPLNIKCLYDLKVKELSGGEKQIVGIVMCLGKPADMYLLDEPSTYLDTKQRVNVCKVIKRFITNTEKIALIIDHDFMMTSFLADKIILFTGKPGIYGKASSPLSFNEGMNTFLKNIDVTFRIDKETHRMRVNKKNSVKDIEQKKMEKYLF